MAGTGGGRCVSGERGGGGGGGGGGTEGNDQTDPVTKRRVDLRT